MSERNKNPRVNVRNLVELMRANEGSEFLSYYPEWKAPYEKTKSSFDKLVMQLESNTAEGDLAAQCAVAIKDGNASSVRNFLASCPIETLLSALAVSLEEKVSGSDETTRSVAPAKKEEAPKLEPLQPQRRRKQGAPGNIFDMLAEN